MEVADFIPAYPSVRDEQFYQKIYDKKEFNDLKILDKFDNERIGNLEKYQEFVSRFLSTITPYPSLLLFHEMGSGKCVLPDTDVFVNNKYTKIEDIWFEHCGPNVPDTDEMWIDICYKNIFSVSIDSKLVFKKSNVSKLFRQKIDEKICKVTLKNGKSISVTRQHPLLTEHGWMNDIIDNKNVKFIATYDNENIKFIKISKIELVMYTGYVYDLEIPYYHNFLANSIICHNTFSTIGTIENAFSMTNNINKAVVLLKNNRLLKEFRHELVYKATNGKYLPEDYESLSPESLSIRITRLISERYILNTFEMFAKNINRLSNNEIRNKFSNSYIIIDEVQNLQSKEETMGKKSEIINKNFIYHTLHNFLHTVNNSKILLLSGTPVRDNPNEIRNIANLLLPRNNQIEKGTELNKGVLENCLRGYVSYVRIPPSNIKREIIFSVDSKNVGLDKIPVYFDVMSEFQTNIYISTYMSKKYNISNFSFNDPRLKVKNLGSFDEILDDVEKYEDDEDEIITEQGNITISRGFTLYKELSQAINFIFPNRKFGREGFETNIISSNKRISSTSSRTVYRFKPEIRSTIKENLATYSQKFKNIVDSVQEPNKCCFIYIESVSGSGAILLGLILELFGFKMFDGSSNLSTKEKRYSILTGTTSLASETSNVLRNFNSSDNMYGEYLKVIIGSKVLSEGFSLYHVQKVHIVMPHWVSCLYIIKLPFW